MVINAFGSDEQEIVMPDRNVVDDSNITMSDPAVLPERVTILNYTNFVFK